MAYIGRPSIVGNFVKLDSITAVNGQAAYTMQNGGANFTDYSSVNQFMVSLNSVVQSPGSSFTVSGSTLTFASNLATGDVIDFVIVFGNSLSSGVPTDATVTAAKLTANAITGQTAETSIATDDTILIHDTSASALRKMTRANFVSGIGGTNTPYFSALKTSNQTISDGASTKVTFDSEQIASSSGVFDVSNNKFTATVGGIYQFNVKITFYDSSNKLKRMDAYIFKNNSQNRKEIFFDDAGDIREVCLTTSFIDSVSVNDYYELYVYGDTTDNGSYDISGNASGSSKETFFQAFKLTT